MTEFVSTPAVPDPGNLDRVIPRTLAGEKNKNCVRFDADRLLKIMFPIQGNKDALFSRLLQ